MPVNVTGLNFTPGAGDRFYVLNDITQARQLAQNGRPMPANAIWPAPAARHPGKSLRAAGRGEPGADAPYHPPCRRPRLDRSHPERAVASSNMRKCRSRYCRPR